MTAAEAHSIAEGLNLSSAICKLVADAPPLSDKQRDQLRRALDLPNQPERLGRP